MKRARTIPFLAFAMFLAVACSDGGPAEPMVEGITLADLVGSWTATSHLYTNNATPSQTFDLIANGGETRITVLANAGTRIWVTIGDYYDEWDTRLSLNGTTLTSTPAEAARGVSTWAVSMDGGLLTITNANSSFDFTLLGGPEVAATEKIVFRRN